MEQAELTRDRQRVQPRTPSTVTDSAFSRSPRPAVETATKSESCSMCIAQRPRLLYRVTDVAETLSISRAKVYELIAAGSLPSVRLDGCRRVRHQDLLQFIARLGSVA
jgi:excisionase family DNA binding protein